MAVKRKRRKSFFNPVVRGQAVRLKASAEEAEQEAALNNAALNSLPSDSHAFYVMLVITVAGILFIGFITWCIALMPTK
jgi:hypothetical protein